MTRTMWTVILLITAQLPCAAQDKPAEDAIDPREAIRCGTFYLLGSEKHKGEEISRVYELAARGLLEPAMVKVGEKKAMEWTDEFLAEFMKVPKKDGKFDAYLKDLRDRCEPLAIRGARETSISLAAFSDGIKHWQDRHGSDYARYQPQQITEIADNLLLYQRDNGGWIENRDPARILDATEKAALVAEKSQASGSFDNRNIYSQIEYLATAFGRTGKAVYRDAAARGLDYALAQQIASCGGWPHTVPGTSSYHRYITIADEVTSGLLRLLRKISAGADPFGYVDAASRARSKAALDRGDECVLKLQVVQNGQLTGWAGQYDPDTLQPAQGRAFELPSIVSQETVEMLRYLMSIQQPSAAQVKSIESAVAWLRRSQVSGVRLEKVTLEKPVQYQYHVATFDYRLVDDAKAPPLWARFYDLKDNTIVLANRDSVRVKDFSEIHPERRSGYSWFGTWPATLLNEEYPAWRARHAR